MSRIHFVFIGEGTSDDGLIPHLENLCIELGADEVTGTAVDYQRLDARAGHTVEAKLKAALQLEPEANFWFIHRDSDDPDPRLRYEEISRAVERCGLAGVWVAVVPVQEIEAWLLLDEAAIRSVAGRPRGSEPLNLPTPRQIESRASPKELLKESLVRAADVTGRRLQKFHARFPAHRRQLLQGLPTGGLLDGVASWKRMRDDLEIAITRLCTRNVQEPQTVAGPALGINGSEPHA
jgi:hypothetical protein